MRRGTESSVKVNPDYLRLQIKKSGIKYGDLAKLVGRSGRGSLSGAISTGKFLPTELKKIARICDFPYEDALVDNQPKAYIKKNSTKTDIKKELDRILDMQIQINKSLIQLLQHN